jgi:hypothetical protein
MNHRFEDCKETALSLPSHRVPSFSKIARVTSCFPEDGKRKCEFLSLNYVSEDVKEYFYSPE